MKAIAITCMFMLLGAQISHGTTDCRFDEYPERVVVTCTGDEKNTVDVAVPTLPLHTTAETAAEKVVRNQAPRSSEDSEQAPATVSAPQSRKEPKGATASPGTSAATVDNPGDHQAKRREEALRNSRNLKSNTARALGPREF